MSDSTDTAPRKMFAIMRLGKISSTTVLRHVSNHNTRAVMSENVERDGPAPIELLEEGSDDFVASAADRMAELGIDPASAKGKIIAVEAVVSASRAWFAQATDEEKAEWKRASVAWRSGCSGAACSRRSCMRTRKCRTSTSSRSRRCRRSGCARAQAGIGGSAPGARRGRRRAPMIWTLAYHDILGGKSDRLSQEQDTYHGFVRHLGLERGEKQQEATTIAMGDELSIEVGDLARGVDADGNARPRRSLTPKQYRARIKQLEAEASAARAEADRDRADAAALGTPPHGRAARFKRSWGLRPQLVPSRKPMPGHWRTTVGLSIKIVKRSDGRTAAVTLRERDVQATKDAVDIARREVERQRDDLTISLAAAARATDVVRDKAIAAAKATTAAEADREAAAR